MFLLRFVLLLILFYLLIQILGRFLFGFSRRGRNAYYSDNDSRHNRKEGGVYVDSNANKKHKIIRKDEGEYINYEEIKDSDR
jgi:hypothetical protein